MKSGGEYTEVKGYLGCRLNPFKTGFATVKVEKKSGETPKEEAARIRTEGARIAAEKLSCLLGGTFETEQARADRIAAFQKFKEGRDPLMSGPKL